MRAVSVHEDAIVVTSLFWQLNAVALRAGGEAMLIDSPYFPEELELLPTVLAQAGFEPVALMATHADFDHLLGRVAFPELSLGVAESSMLRIRAEPGAAQRELRDYDDRAYVVRPRPLSLGQTQSLPVPGRLGLGEREELELHATGGHTSDGMAVFAPWLGVLVVGDYLSPVEIPMISPGGSVADYRGTLAALAPVVERAAKRGARPRCGAGPRDGIARDRRGSGLPGRAGAGPGAAAAARGTRQLRAAAHPRRERGHAAA